MSVHIYTIVLYYFYNIILLEYHSRFEFWRCSNRIVCKMAEESSEVVKLPKCYAIPLDDLADAAVSFHNNNNGNTVPIPPLGNPRFVLAHLATVTGIMFRRYPWKTPQCKARYPWQLSSLAVLLVWNILHEQGFSSLGSARFSSTQMAPTAAKRIARGHGKRSGRWMIITTRVSAACCTEIKLTPQPPQQQVICLFSKCSNWTIHTGHLISFMIIGKMRLSWNDWLLSPWFSTFMAFVEIQTCLIMHQKVTWNTFFAW